ncbi:SecDF P1 head subdomain-containing protein [Kitasatospora phosalacinea]|uniref:SecDF P1 head subdomain-containing protein n=1 Tax=Kitasatospora phosalacinea TaxID=2065 RepID=UPI000AE0B23D|nr:hypothetical protein [Kitasatospora phosalacinea]
MEHSRRTVGATALLLACALGATACDSGTDPSPAPPTGAATTAGNGTTTVFTTDRPLNGEALTRAAEQLRHRAELLGLPHPEVKTDGGTLALTTAGPVGDRLAALTHRPVLEMRPVLATAPVGAAPAAPAEGDVPAQWKDRFEALDCAAATSPGTASPTATTAPADPGAETLACGGAETSGSRSKFVLGPVAVQGADIADSSAARDQNGAGWQVRLHFTPAGTGAFGSLTGRISTLQSPANQLAVLVDGTVLSHPYVAQAITGGEAVISGSFDEDDAKQLAAQLATQSLPADLHPAATDS